MIASYYLESHIFLEMSASSNFKNSSINEIIEKYKDKLRDDSPIKDLEDFLLTLHYLTFWDITLLPQIIYDYLNLNLFEDYSQLDESISFEIITKIVTYVKSKFKHNRIIDYTENSVYTIKENGKLFSIRLDGNIKNEVPEGKFISVSCSGHNVIAIRDDHTAIGWTNNCYGKFIEGGNNLYGKIVIQKEKFNQVFFWY